MGKMMQLAEIIYRFIALNILWVIFSVAGLGIFGVMPATVALFSVVRDWLKGEKELPIFSSYLKYYKIDFFRSNIFGLLFLGIFYVIYVNFSFVSYFYAAEVQIYIYIVVSFFAAIAAMTFINLFSVMAHYNFKGLQYIKVAAGLVFFHPFKTMIQLVWVIAYLLIAIFIPKLFILIGVSIFAFILMSLNYSVFNKVEAT